MNAAKTAILDVTGGLFLGKLAESIFPSPGPMSAATAPKYLFETLAETSFLAFLTVQYMKWRNSFGFASRDTLPLFFILSIYVTSSQYIKRLRGLANWSQGLINSELKMFSGSTTSGTVPGLATGMVTQTHPQTGYDKTTGPTDHVNGDLLQTPYEDVDSV